MRYLVALRGLARYVDLACAGGQPVEFGTEYHELAEAASSAIAKANGD